MSNQTGLLQDDVDRIAEAYRGFPTAIMGAIVMPVLGSPNTLRIISIAEACQIIRDRQAPLKFEMPDSVEFVLQMVNVYQRAETNGAKVDFTIGPGNTYQQAWSAALIGHQIQLPIWSQDMSWVFERNHKELLEVYGDNTESWKRSGKVVCPTGAHQLRTDWIVLPIVDLEPLTI